MRDNLITTFARISSPESACTRARETVQVPSVITTKTHTSAANEHFIRAPTTNNLHPRPEELQFLSQ